MNWSLAVISALSGVFALLVIRWTSNPRRIAAAKRKAQAHWMELLIFDEPRVIWKALRSLVAANVRYMGVMLVPAIVATVPLALLLLRLDARYGHRPLEVNKPATITVSMKGYAMPVLTAPPGIEVETPAVRAVPLGEVSWRVRANSEVSDLVRIEAGGVLITKRVEAGSTWRSPFYAVDFGPVEIDYPATEGHWLLWFCLIAFGRGLVLKRPLGVVL